MAENRASLDYTQINYYYVVTTIHTPGENHLTEAEQDSRTVVEWHTFDEMVRLINEQEFERIQGKYLKARDVVALYEYSNAQFEKLGNQLGMSIALKTIYDADSDRYNVNEDNGTYVITLNAAKIPAQDYKIHAGYHIGKILLPRLRLKTARLVLRRYQPDDAMQCFAFLSNDQDAYMDCSKAFTEMDEAYYELMDLFSQREMQYMITLKESNEVIGTVNVFADDSRAVDTMEIGYSIAHVHQRKGYAYGMLEGDWRKMTFVETPRLLLRKVTEEDYSYFREDLMDKEMDRMMWRSPCETEEDVRLGFEWFLYKEERAYAIVHKETGETIGNLTVYNRVPECVANHEAVQGKNGKVLSFAVLPAFRRKGFMYEAVSSVIDHLFREEKAEYINCGYLSYNTPSKALQEKLGFTYLLTERLPLDGQEVESIENILWRK